MISDSLEAKNREKNETTKGKCASFEVSSQRSQQSLNIFLTRPLAWFRNSRTKRMEKQEVSSKPCACRKAVHFLLSIYLSLNRLILNIGNALASFFVLSFDFSFVEQSEDQWKVLVWTIRFHVQRKHVSTIIPRRIVKCNWWHWPYTRWASTNQTPRIPNTVYRTERKLKDNQRWFKRPESSSPLIVHIKETEHILFARSICIRYRISNALDKKKNRGKCKRFVSKYWLRLHNQEHRHTSDTCQKK